MKRRRASGHALPLTCLLSTSGETAPATRPALSRHVSEKVNLPRPTGLEHVHLCCKTLLLWASAVCDLYLNRWNCFFCCLSNASTHTRGLIPPFHSRIFLNVQTLPDNVDWFAEQTLSRMFSAAQHSGAKALGRCLFREGWRLDRVKDQRLALFAQSSAERTRLITQAAAKADWALTERETSELISALQCVCGQSPPSLLPLSLCTETMRSG